MPKCTPARSFARSLAVACALLVFGAPLARAQHAPDRRMLTAALRTLVMPDREPETLDESRVDAGVETRRGADSHLLRRWWLRTPQAYGKSTATPRVVAESFLEAHAGDLGLPAAMPLANLALASEKASPSGTHLRWNQTVDGVPVFRAEVVVKVNRDGQVSSVQNNLVPDVVVDTKPAIDATQAIAAAKNFVRPTGKALMDPKADLQVVATREGARLAWVVQMPVEAPMGDWLVFVDANGGAVLGGEDRMRYAEGTGRVFDPDPMTKMADSTYHDNSDADTAVPFPAAYDIVPLHGITLTSGTYSLSGPYAQLIDDESPTFAPVTATSPDSFRYQRSAQGFEDVMCYYQIDTAQRYIQSLGFTNIDNRSQPVDSHGLSGADNSHYVPSTGHLAFGEGGVDDAEDADVIWHEYGHSIQDNIVPGWGGGEEGQMGEGFGDYWAGSYSWFKSPTFQINRVFTWDGNGDTWTGRLLVDPALHYPADCCGEVHASGTLWCSGLIDCLHRLGRPVMDAIVLDHHFALGTSATMADAAAQVIQSDIDLFGGAHVGTLVERFGVWGFVNPANYAPSITHTPLPGSENIAGPYAVTATVSSAKALATGFPRLYWGFGAAITDSSAMTLTSTANVYTANIPGPGFATDVRYYIRATDNSGGTVVSPSTAPATPNVFHVGPNTVAPVIVHSPISVCPVLSWPPVVTATVTDDISVDPASVKVNWTYNGVAQTAFALVRSGSTNTWSASFPAMTVIAGDAIAYDIVASDQAATPNSTRSPATGEYAFSLTASLGSVLVLDDDELAKTGEPKQVPLEKDPSQFVTETDKGGYTIQSANRMAAWLSAMGYTVTVQSAAAPDTTTWPGHSFIVSASGSNTGPVANATTRAGLESWVLAGHKLIVEGGEVGYDAIASPGYATFASRVLHGSAWAADNAGTLVQVAAQAAHPLATTPNVLPASIPITYASYGNEDSYAVTSPAVVVYGTTTQTGNAGISAYDNDNAPQAGQIVVLAFDIKTVTDSTVARKVLENAAHYLLAPQPSPLSAITGRVALGAAWAGAGVTVTLSPGGATTTTAADGSFAFNTLYAGTYSVSATATGYSGTPRNVTVAQSALASIVLRLYATSMASNCNNPALAIPDNSATGVTNAMTITPVFAVTDVQCSVNITHTYKGDLIVELRHGSTNVRLHNRTGGSADNIVGTYPTTITPYASLSSFFGQSSTGTWTLFVSDNASADTGTLNQWCLTLKGASDTTSTVGADAPVLPVAAEFSAPWPNPSRGGNVTLAFTLPHAARARIALYDVGGRLVRTVADRAFGAGRYVLAWDGHGDDGAALKPGMYLARLSTGGETLTRRVFILQ